MTFFRITSIGCSFFSYIAKKKNGNAVATSSIIAFDVPICGFVKRNTGNDTAAAAPKLISCRLVRFSATFVLTLVKSFGTCTYGI